MRGSFEDGEVVVRMSKREANSLTEVLMYTIDYREGEYPEYHELQQVLYRALRMGESA